ncbi:BolA protein family transcriptional regulator [Kushneria sinocarnis]|uniref:DNA-binding transcriptional regulator BolA n=1 Tax=Kushneria sinocarnis TaxID=595502 RepID=A0A420WXS2_9GAMM|nr:BolA/IbaG family iron-sulfur metabolism protein [Kushneria sinocarnis]RKR04487.1 BolA protein family transcriptional regulator [Kushneria sinocarnis]
MSMQTRIEEKLQQAFAPRWLSVENESYMHNVPPDAETHFKVTMVSEKFEGLMPVKRHQQIYCELADEMAGPVHALALHLYTPAQWEARGNTRPDSPDCRGGGGR